MGIDLYIDDEQRIKVTGRIKHTFSDERTLDEFMEDWELSSLFEDAPEYATVEVTRETLTPPLPDDLQTTHVGMPYSAFSRMRTKLAAAIGLDLEMMWGFQPNPIRIGEIRRLDVRVGAIAAGYEQWEREQVAWWTERSRQWDTVDNGMVPLLSHSDCEGEMTPAECAQVAPALAKAIESMPEEDVPPGYRTDRAKAVDLLALIEACAKYERRLLFR